MLKLKKYVYVWEVMSITLVDTIILYNMWTIKIVDEICKRHTPCVVGPCHHGMARPQVADRGTASNMEGSCE